MYANRSGIRCRFDASTNACIAFSRRRCNLLLSSITVNVSERLLTPVGAWATVANIRSINAESTF